MVVDSLEKSGNSKFELMLRGNPICGGLTPTPPLWVTERLPHTPCVRVDLAELPRCLY
jgi:hypothetical protein